METKKYCFNEELMTVLQSYAALKEQVQQFGEQLTQLAAHSTQHEYIVPNRSMSKSKMAKMLGMSPRKFASFLNEFAPDLEKFHVSKYAKVLPAEVVVFLCEQSSYYEEKDDF